MSGLVSPRRTRKPWLLHSRKTLAQRTSPGFVLSWPLNGKGSVEPCCSSSYWREKRRHRKTSCRWLRQPLMSRAALSPS